MPDEYTTPMPSPCSCSREGRGTTDCWNRAYDRGRGDLVSEVHLVLDTGFEGHAPGHDCVVCGMQRAMAAQNPELAAIPRLIHEGLQAMVGDPARRGALRALLDAADAADAADGG